jgi:tight adherence protein C
MLPQRVLSRWIRERSERLRDGLPTALDLMVLSLEAGQSLDAALIETSRELREPFPDLCAELSLVQLEIFASKSRAEALRNLATRNEELEIRRLAQVFIDSDRFGTSLAPALRMHVHYLRIRTRQKAQEAARKVGVKLVFPVFFLIFPAVLLVTVGPAVLLVVSQLGPMLTNAVP